MKYYVKGTAANNNQCGFIFSNANWDPYPLSNRLESFTIALANMDGAVMLRQGREDAEGGEELEAESRFRPQAASYGVRGRRHQELPRYSVHGSAWKT